MGPELTRIDPRIDPPDHLPDRSRDASDMTSDDPQMALSHMAVSNKALLHVLLTIAEVIRVSSKDWIRPPSQCQEYLNGC